MMKPIYLKTKGKSMKMQKNEQRSVGTPQPTVVGNWVRKGNTVVNKVTGGGVEEFIQAVRNRDADAYRFLDSVVVKRICGERIAKIAIYEKTLEADEVWAVFENWIMAGNGLAAYKNPESFVPYLHCCLRKALKKFIEKESKRRRVETPTLDAPVNAGNGDNETVSSKKGLISEGAEKSVDLNERLDGNERKVVRDMVEEFKWNGCLDEKDFKVVQKLYDEFWRKRPMDAYIFKLHNDGHDWREINEFLGLPTTENNLSKRYGRIKARLRDFISRRFGKPVKEFQ